MWLWWFDAWSDAYARVMSYWTPTPRYLSIESIAHDVYSKLEQHDVIELLKITDRRQLIRYHFTTGMYIRNHYNLWHHPEAAEDPDSDNHPDQMSQRVIERVWELVHEFCKVHVR